MGIEIRSIIITSNNTRFQAQLFCIFLRKTQQNITHKLIHLVLLSDLL